MMRRRQAVDFTEVIEVETCDVLLRVHGEPLCARPFDPALVKVNWSARSLVLICRRCGFNRPE